MSDKPLTDLQLAQASVHIARLLVQARLNVAGQCNSRTILMLERLAEKQLEHAARNLDQAEGTANLEGRPE